MGDKYPAHGIFQGSSHRSAPSYHKSRKHKQNDKPESRKSFIKKPRGYTYNEKGDQKHTVIGGKLVDSLYQKAAFSRKDRKNDPQK